jgi:hypothetical protein
MTEAIPPNKRRLRIWRIVGSRRVVTAGAVADHFPMGSVGNFTRNVFKRTNGVGFVNSGAENRRDSEYGCTSKSVPNVEFDMAMSGLTVLQEYRVKLHEPARSATRQRLDPSSGQQVGAATRESRGQNEN